MNGASTLESNGVIWARVRLAQRLGRAETSVCAALGLVGGAGVDARMREALEAVAESDDDRAIERALLRLPRAPPRVLTPRG